MTFLRCTVLDPAAGAAHDVELDVEPETTITSVLAALPVSVAGRPAYAGPVLLNPRDTVAESPLTAGCLICVGEPVADHRVVPGDAGGVLRVVAGPDLGRWIWVAAGGGATVGRGDRADLLLTDPQVSRLHAEIILATPPQLGATLRDRDSANGTAMAGAAIQGEAELPDGGVFELGSTLVQWMPLERVDRGWRRAPDGRIEFTRRFHSAPTAKPVTVDLPSAPTSSGRGRAALLVSLGGPLLLGLMMVTLTRNLSFLLMTLMAPVTAGVQQTVERRGRRARDAEYAGDQARAAAQIATAVTAEEQVRRLNDPDELSLALCALGALPRLWTKRLGGPDALTVRVGVRDDPASVELRGEKWDGLHSPQLRAVPVTVDLRETGVLGVVGDPVAAEGLARWIMVQLATRRSPEDLSVVVLSSDDGAHLRWTRWLPHLDAGTDGDAPCRIGVTRESRAHRVEELRRLVDARDRARRDGGRPVTFDSDVVVVLDGARDLRDLSGMRTVLSHGPDVGVYPICIDRTDINECRGRVTVDADGGMELIRRFTDPAETATAESTTLDDAERIARLLAPLRDRAHASASEGAIPYPLRYLDLVDIDEPTPEAVLRLWGDHPGPTMQVPLGADERGTVSIDLVRQGPHTMLGGATGAGKSVLLQTLITSLLVFNRPDELNLVLVDFKGGGAFLPFENCPHVVSLILSTGGDGDTFGPADADRVLASIRAEVARRERLLARYGGEIDDYLRRRPADQPPLPRLLMVFDEFARVLDVSRGFVQELVNVAGKGRSLGMHLLLATQSLQGKLTAEMKNNIDLRISLRQNQPEQSTEVLDVPDAVGIPGRLRGRGLILCTKDEPPLARPFQSGYLGDPPAGTGTPPARARIVDWPAVGDSRPPEEKPAAAGVTDQSLLISAIERAAARLSLPRPFRPLLPPLPAAVPLSQLTELATETLPADAVPFGLADDPAGQAQPAEHLCLTGDRRLMIAGGPQSGRTTAVRALIHAATLRFPPSDLHMYVLERDPAGLSVYADLPHCGGVFGPAEPDRIRRFITWLDGEVDRRQATQYADDARPPTLLVLIDGWELLHDPSDQTSIETSLVRMMREVIKTGPKVGVHVVVTCDRGPFATKPADLFDTRLVLRFPSEDVLRGVLRSGTALPARIPGRAVNAGSGRHIQIAQPSEPPEALVGRLSTAGVPPARAPRRFPPLPRIVHAADVKRPDGVSAGWVPLGIGGPDLEPVGVDLFAGPQTLLVSGPPGSGRSTAAATAVHALSAHGVGCVVLCTPRSPLTAWLAGRPNVSVLRGPTLTDEVVRQAATALGTDHLVVVVDDCDQITVVETTKSFEQLPTLLAEATTPDRLGRMGLILCGDAMPLIDGPRRSLTPVTRHALTEGARVLLNPTAARVAREHGMILEADQFVVGAPGRGFFHVNAISLHLKMIGMGSFREAV